MTCSLRSVHLLSTENQPLLHRRDTLLLLNPLFNSGDLHTAEDSFRQGSYMSSRAASTYLVIWLNINLNLRKSVILIEKFYRLSGKRQNQCFYLPSSQVLSSWNGSQCISKQQASVGNEDEIPSLL